MDELTVGDSIQVAVGEFSDVFMFTHNDPYAEHAFVKLSVDFGDELVLSGSHYMYINGELRFSREVQIGDVVSLGGDGGRSVVLERSIMIEKDLYSP